MNESGRRNNRSERTENTARGIEAGRASERASRAGDPNFVTSSISGFRDGNHASFLLHYDSHYDTNEALFRVEGFLVIF